MKKRPEQTKQQRDQELRFIRRGPVNLRKYKKLVRGKVAKEDLVLLLTALWGGLSKVKVKSKKWDLLDLVEIEMRKYKNLPNFASFNKYSRKVLAGMYGNALCLARREGIV